MRSHQQAGLFRRRAAAGIAIGLSLIAGGGMARAEPPVPGAISAAAAKVYEEAIQLIEQKSLDEARAKLAQVTQLEPRFAPAHFNLGYIEETQGNLDAAATAYARAIELDPKDAKAHVALGALHYRSRRHAEALPHYQAATETAPEDAKAWLGLARTEDALDQLEPAAAAARKATELAPADADAYYELGTIETKRATTDGSAAVAALGRALELDPKHANAHIARFYLGKLFYKEKKYAEAAASFEKATELQPGFAEAYFGLGQARGKAGEIEPAIAAYKKAIELKAPDPYGGAHFNLAVLYQKREAWDEALAEFKAAAADPKFESAGKAAESAKKIENFLASRKQAPAGY